MPEYELPLWAHDDELFPAGIHGKGWRITTTEAFIGPARADFDAHLMTVRERYPGYSVMHIGSGRPRRRNRIAPQLIVEASSRLTAQRVFHLINAALVILDGSVFLDMEEGLVTPRNRTDLEDISERDVGSAASNTMGRPGLILGCGFAAQLSARRCLQYAAFKLLLSFRLTSTHVVDLDPHHGAHRFKVERNPLAHVHCATAITLAYSAVEELQLEPRSIANQPVKTSDVWDPGALSDLQGRLRRAKIDLADLLVWTTRGTPTRIHKARRAPKGVKASWTRGVVRDREIFVEDALVAASWARNKVTTHRYNAETSSLTVYDVHNVQFLARRLLMEHLGRYLSRPGRAAPTGGARAETAAKRTQRVG
jgi:hypothetical protein